VKTTILQVNETLHINATTKCKTPDMIFEKKPEKSHHSNTGQPTYNLFGKSLVGIETWDEHVITDAPYYPVSRLKVDP